MQRTLPLEECKLMGCRDRSARLARVLSPNQIRLEATTQTKARARAPSSQSLDQEFLAMSRCRSQEFLAKHLPTFQATQTYLAPSRSLSREAPGRNYQQSRHSLSSLYQRPSSLPVVSNNLAKPISRTESLFE
jgi:DsbC/DsbD-like thiol-disulfide interchange protein